MPMQIVQQKSILQLVSKEASVRTPLLLARAVRSISKTGKEMDVQQGRIKREAASKRA